MEIALIHNSSLILGPIGFNVRMINSELEDLEVEERINSQSYINLPIHFSDGITHLLPIESEIPQYDPKYYNLGNFTWEIIEENQIPTQVKLTYPLIEKTLDEVKYLRKSEVSPIRRQKENVIITLNVNDTSIEVSTSRENRVALTSKLASASSPYKFKFLNTWLEVTDQNIQHILNEIDIVVQSAFDWEFSKLQEIDACETIDEIYDVIIQEQTGQSNEQIIR